VRSPLWLSGSAARRSEGDRHPGAVDGQGPVLVAVHVGLVVGQIHGRDRGVEPRDVVDQEGHPVGQNSAFDSTELNE
jgi:hypothetical protein